MEACYANKPLRSDSEHRALLALAKAKIALRSGDADNALTFATQAAERQQWFGKIGTNQNDIEFAARITMAEAIAAKTAAMKDHAFASLPERLTDYGQIPILKIQQWWIEKQARESALTELDDFEDLYIRHTDAMLEYPTLGFLTKSFPTRAFESRVDYMLKTDEREEAKKYYRLYLAINYYYPNNVSEAYEQLTAIYPSFRSFDRLARAEALFYLIKIEEQKHHFWQSAIWGSETVRNLIVELFSLSPAMRCCL